MGSGVGYIRCYHSHSLILVTGSSTWHLMSKNSEDLKKRIVLHKDGLGYEKIAKTLKLSCSTVAKTIQRFNRTGSTQNRPRHGPPKKLSAQWWWECHGLGVLSWCDECCRHWGATVR
ncbi:unnamed protein product [Staurois parvus]|uniref:Helix-turn-helix domain-containing protein n=1 Tax=Staurois parvus TaxID=386267 RepID=A0ABN9BH35_9NEOB|nr:unnamed protein product [Staurois parvus]